MKPGSPQSLGINRRPAVSLHDDPSQGHAKGHAAEAVSLLQSLWSRLDKGNRQQLSTQLVKQRLSIFQVGGIRRLSRWRFPISQAVQRTIRREIVGTRCDR